MDKKHLFRDYKISFVNPVSYVNQWYSARKRWKAVFHWLFFVGKFDYMDCWTDDIIRVLGFQIHRRTYNTEVY